MRNLIPAAIALLVLTSPPSVVGPSPAVAGSHDPFPDSAANEERYETQRRALEEEGTTQRRPPVPVDLQQRRPEIEDVEDDVEPDVDGERGE
jgi:hypothetical protein